MMSLSVIFWFADVVDVGCVKKLNCRLLLIAGRWLAVKVFLFDSVKKLNFGWWCFSFFLFSHTHTMPRPTYFVHKKRSKRGGFSVTSHQIRREPLLLLKPNRYWLGQIKITW